MFDLISRANEWTLDSPEWTGRMRVVVKSGSLLIKLEDKSSGQLFAQAPVDTYPGVAIEAVSDSSRYFVIRVQDDNGTLIIKKILVFLCPFLNNLPNLNLTSSGRSAFLGIGFADRSDSFDLNVALQDHFKWLQKEQDIQKEKETPKPGLDLGFKDGQTIKINMKITVCKLFFMKETEFNKLLLLPTAYVAAFFICRKKTAVNHRPEKGKLVERVCCLLLLGV